MTISLPYLLKFLKSMFRPSYVQVRRYQDLQGHRRQQHSPGQCCWLIEIPTIEGAQDIVLVALLIALAAVVKILAHGSHHGPLCFALSLLHVLLLLLVLVLVILLLLLLGLLLMVLIEELMGDLLIV